MGSGRRSCNETRKEREEKGDWLAASLDHAGVPPCIFWRDGGWVLHGGQSDQYFVAEQHDGCLLYTSEWGLMMKRSIASPPFVQYSTQSGKLCRFTRKFYKKKLQEMLDNFPGNKYTI